MKSLRPDYALILILTALIAVSLPACKPAAKETANTASVVASATAVTAVPAVRQTISEKVVYTGLLEPWRKIAISPESGGKIARIPVEEGQRVAAGQLLAELDTETIRLQLNQAEAGLSVAEANLQNAARNKERMERLAAQKAVSDQQAEQVKLAYDAAKAQAEQATAGVNLARHVLNTAVMTAPWAGIVAAKNAQVGDIVNPMMGGYGAAAGVVTLMDDSRIKVVVEVNAADMARLRKGGAAVLRAGNGEAAEHAGTVAVLNSTADPLSRKFRVEVDVPNPGWKLRPGVFGTVVFEVQSHQNALAIPQRAVLDGAAVFVVEGGKAVKRAVTLGLKNTTMIEVVDGLKEGDLVIVEGNFGLIEGTPVEVKK